MLITKQIRFNDVEVLFMIHKEFWVLKDLKHYCLPRIYDLFINQ